MLKEHSSYPWFELFFTTLSDEEQNTFLSAIKNVKRKSLYPGLLHGRYHSEKVCLFSYILGIELGFSDEVLKILCDASLYHDFRRENDSENSLHGYSAAYFIDEVIGDDPFYKNEEYKLLLRAIIDLHSVKDGRTPQAMDLLYLNYDLDKTSIDFELFCSVAHALMDADALDRLRFSKASFAALKPELLKYDFSRDMIPLAEEVNEAYRKYEVDRDVDFSVLEELTGAVCHSTGFIFSRIPFILKYGVLSKSEQDKMNVGLHRNFEGGNAQRWISVVPVSLIKEGNTSNATFLDNGIVIRTFEEQEFYRSSYDGYSASIASSHNVPYIKGGHKEERFVFERIDPKNIDELYISNKCANSDLSDLQYIFPNIDYMAYKKILDYILQEYHAIPQDEERVSKLYEKYKNLVVQYGTLSLERRRESYDSFTSSLEELNLLINKVLAVVIKKAYVQRFGLHHKFVKITPTMVLEDQLLYLGVPYRNEILEDRVSFKINLNKRKDIETDIHTMGSK